MDWELFLSALVSSTLLPGSSEAMLIYKIHAGGNPLALVITASIGNVLGSLITYVMGRAGNEVVHRKWLRISEQEVARAEFWFDRYGQPSLLFAWLPVVGDPLCLVAGLFRSPVINFIVLVGIGKIGRYAAIAWLS